MPVVTVGGRIDEVTIYASGARIVRVATLDAVAGHVRITGLPLAVIDDTLRIEIDGPAIATAVRADLDAPAAAVAAPETAPALRAAERTVALGEADVARLDAALGALGRAPVIAEPPPSDEPPAAWGDILAARRTVIAARGQREAALRDEAARARRALDDARRGLAAELDRESRTTTAKAAKAHELRKHVDITLEPVAGAAAGPITIRLEYLVDAARWAPTYVARLESEAATLEMRAAIAQATGEDWMGVRLRLSTAEPTRFAPLPELAAQRIGRRQDEVQRSGFRAPPVGAAALYADFDRARPPVQAKKPSSTSIAREVWDEESSRAKEAFHTPPAGNLMPPPRPASAPMRFGSAPMAQQAPARSRAAPADAYDDFEDTGAHAEYPMAESSPAPPMPVAYAKSRGGALANLVGGLAGGGGGGPQSSRAAPGGAYAKQEHAPGAAPRPVPRLDYNALRMAGPTAPGRGTLVPAGAGAGSAYGVEEEVAAGAARVLSLPLPPGCRVEWAHSYDYAYTADGAVDIVADGDWHSIAITAAATTATLRHVATPREQADVFRLATLANPFAGPLLPGPIDVYDRGRFLVTSDVESTAPGATVELGLGVDPSVKIARNTEFREEAAGMLRGALRLHHAVAIDVENLAGRSIDLEVRERIPVTREGEDDIEVTVGRIEPGWERYTPDPDAPKEQRLRGGYRWKLAVPAGAKRTLRAAYDVKINSKLELVGGNRRDA